MFWGDIIYHFCFTLIRVFAVMDKPSPSSAKGRSTKNDWRWQGGWPAKKGQQEAQANLHKLQLERMKYGAFFGDGDSQVNQSGVPFANLVEQNAKQDTEQVVIQGTGGAADNNTNLSAGSANSYFIPAGSQVSATLYDMDIGGGGGTGIGANFDS